MKKLKLLILFSAIMLSGCGKTTETDDGKIHVKFDTTISLKTNTIKEQVYDEAHKVKKPVVVIIDENPDSLELYGWYTDKEYTTQWNFKTDIAEKSMTLYGKFVSQYKVNYYQGIDENNISLLATELVFKGDVVPSREDLPDCYENPGNYYLTDVTTKEDGTISAKKGETVKFDEDVVTNHTNILLERSSNFYLSPGAISRRFTPTAANNGVNGSSIGKIEVVEEENGEEYAKVDFGIVSDTETVVDPYILIDNPAIDVTNSEYIEIKMKNIGRGETLSFYWVGKWEINNQWINGKEYHSFGEDRRFAFAKGNSKDDLNIGTIYKDLNGLSYANMQKDEDGWQTYKIPISWKYSNGVSTWGCAGKITALRIQSSFKMESLPKQKDGKILEKDKQNTLLIKYIKGVHDTENTYDFIDSDEIKNLSKNDDEALVKQAADAQEQINGFVFPKNNDAIHTKEDITKSDEEYTTANVYKKTDGTYFGCQYKDGAQKIVLIPKNEVVLTKKDEVTKEYTVLNSTFTFKYRNLSYISKINFTLKVSYTDDYGNKKEKTITTAFTPGTRMESADIGKINYFGDSYFNGVLKELTISYNPIGIDNLIKFEYLKFGDYEPKMLNGFNFNDKNYADFEIESGLNSFKYVPQYKATKVETLDENNAMYYDLSKFDNSLMEAIEFNYVKPDDGITSFKLIITTNGHEETYEPVLPLETSSKAGSVYFELREVGNISKVKLSFEGIGVIYLKSLLWDFVDSNVNFANDDFYNANSKFADAMSGYKYDSNELGMVVSDANKEFYCRLGAWNYSIDGEKVYNLSMAGKTKLVMMYQNRSTSSTNQYFSFGCVSKQDNLEKNAYLTKDALPNNSITLNGETKKPGVSESTRYAVDKNMKTGEWSVLMVDLDPFYTRSEFEVYLSSFYFRTATIDGSFFIRAFALI